MKGARFAAGSLVVALAWWSSSCAPSGFLGSSSLTGVRVLASSADLPYAQPGALVNLQVLSYDGRPASAQTVPMNFNWLIGCLDPTNDAYFACFPPKPGTLFGLDAGPTLPVDAGDGDGGAPLADGGAAPSGDGGTCATLDSDAGIAAPVVAHSSFVMPPDAVSAHMPTPGVPPYGLALAFNIACAGDAGLLPISPGDINPQQIPFGCFDSSGKQVSPDDYVLGFARVYAYPGDAGPDGGPVFNQNPVILDVDEPNESDGGNTPHCFQGSSSSFVTSPLTAPLCVPGGPCPTVKIGPVVPASSQETDPFNHLRELIWVDFFSTFGGFKWNAKLLYDPNTGSVGPPSTTDTEFMPPVPGPNDPHAGYIFMVVHDERGGVAWVTVPVQLRP
jgi:hypothetical protein